VLLSNHGGRQLDFARSAIEVLPEVMKALKEISVSCRARLRRGD
jgi:isopentenyl diphosphate isomerase/L-lactate dehydrogenase-like FMN-dependent dehydrogenase